MFISIVARLKLIDNNFHINLKDIPRQRKCLTFKVLSWRLTQIINFPEEVWNYNAIVMIEGMIELIEKINESTHWKAYCCYSGGETVFPGEYQEKDMRCNAVIRYYYSYRLSIISSKEVGFMPSKQARQLNFWQLVVTASSTRLISVVFLVFFRWRVKTLRLYYYPRENINSM